MSLTLTVFPDKDVFFFFGLSVLLFLMMRLPRTQRIVAVVVGFAEDRMMDIITGRVPPLARAELYLSKGSWELARPVPSLLETLGLGRHRC